MNLILSFMHVRKPAHVAGPFQALRLDASTLRNAANDEVLAVHREHQWEVEGVRYHRVDSSSRVRIHFERSSREPAAASRRFGPFDRFSAVDGIAYADDRVIAALDASARDWFSYEDGRRWHFMVVTDAAAGNAAKALAMLAALAPLLHALLGIVTPRCRASRSPRLSMARERDEDGFAQFLRLGLSSTTSRVALRGKSADPIQSLLHRPLHGLCHPTRA